MRRILWVITVSLLMASCSFVSDDGTEHEKPVTPDIILENATYTLGQTGEPPIFIKSSRIELYSDDNRAITEALSFIQYNDDGEIRLEGSADSSEIDTESKVMKLDGNVRLAENESGMMIEADTLMFDSENDEVTADGNVKVVSDDGEFEGTGFAGDLLLSSYSFASIEKGVFRL